MNMEKDKKSEKSAPLHQQEEISNEPRVAQMDEREGVLNPGETGGNFNPKDAEEKNLQNAPQH